MWDRRAPGSSFPFSHKTVRVPLDDPPFRGGPRHPAIAIAEEILKLLSDVYMRGMTREPPIDDDEVVDGRLLAQRLGLTATSLSRLASYGALRKATRGKYWLWGSVRAYLAHRDREAASRASPASTARAELLKIQAARAALAFARERGELVDVEDVTDRVTALFKICRAGMLALPARLAARCGLTRETALAADDEIRAVLTEIGSTKAEAIVAAAAETAKRGSMTALSERIDLAARDTMHADLKMLADDAVVGFDELVEWLSELPEGLRRFIKEGIVTPTEPDGGRFLLKASIEAYCQFWEALIADQDLEGGLASAWVAGEA